MGDGEGRSADSPPVDKETGKFLDQSCFHFIHRVGVMGLANLSTLCRQPQP